MMSMAQALSILLTLALSIQLGGCKATALQETRKEFTIQNFSVDGSRGELSLSWSSTPDAGIYRVWIAKNPDCSKPLAQIATQDTHHLFGRAAPGTYYGCVQAVPSFQYGSSDSCTSGISDVDGKGFNATNQGVALTVTAQRQGRWTKLEGSYSNPTLVDTGAGLFVRSGAQLLILNEQGQRLKQLRPLPITQALKIRYAYTGSQIFAMSAKLEVSQLFQWNEDAQNWTMIHEFPGQHLAAFHLVSPTDLSFVLRQQTNQMIQWHSLDPANPSVLKSWPALSSGADNWGFGYYYFASLYVEGAFVIADNRGLHRLTPDQLVPLVVQVGMEPNGIFFFPGAEAEYVLHLGDLMALHAPPPTPLLCSIAVGDQNDWIVWNSKTNRWRKFPINAFEGYSQFINAGPVSMSYLLGGLALQVMAGDRAEVYADLPATAKNLLPGPQLPQNRLLLSGDEDLWMFEPGQP